MSATPAAPLSVHVARKRFGQHFLHDPQVIARIVAMIDPKPGETLVEIGPGLGALTRPLLDRAQTLHVVEIDRDVVPHLRAACSDAPGLHVHLADALRFDYASLVPTGGVLRLAGNLPYNISTPLLFHLLGHAAQVRDMHFMLQKEVVDRLTAVPGGKDYGRLTVTMAARAQVIALFDVGPGAFRPPPKVMSSVVRILPRAPAFEITDAAAYDDLVTAAFSQRRKQLLNGLRSWLNAEQIAACGVEPSARAETLSPAQFAQLANHWAAQRG